MQSQRHVLEDALPTGGRAAQRAAAAWLSEVPLQLNRAEAVLYYRIGI